MIVQWTGRPIGPRTAGRIAARGVLIEVPEDRPAGVARSAGPADLTGVRAARRAAMIGRRSGPAPGPARRASRAARRGKSPAGIRADGVVGIEVRVVREAPVVPVAREAPGLRGAEARSRVDAGSGGSWGEPANMPATGAVGSPILMARPGHRRLARMRGAARCWGRASAQNIRSGPETPPKHPRNPPNRPRSSGARTTLLRPIHVVLS